jgi:hypothetical protein
VLNFAKFVQEKSLFSVVNHKSLPIEAANGEDFCMGVMESHALRLSHFIMRQAFDASG